MKHGKQEHAADYRVKFFHHRVGFGTGNKLAYTFSKPHAGYARLITGK
jgi:hypothetical protein